MQQRDEDELWLEIVANYGDRVLDDEPGYDDPAPADPDAPSALPDVPPGPSTDRGAGGPEETEGSERGDRADSGAGASDDGRREPPDLFAVWADEGRFVPPPPPKVPLPAPPRLLAWLGVFGAPALLLITVVLGVYLPQLLKFGLLAWFVGGFAYLVGTMPQEPRDPGDDGARI